MAGDTLCSLITSLLSIGFCIDYSYISCYCCLIGDLPFYFDFFFNVDTKSIYPFFSIPLFYIDCAVFFWQSRVANPQKARSSVQ